MNNRTEQFRITQRVSDALLAYDIAFRFAVSAEFVLQTGLAARPPDYLEIRNTFHAVTGRVQEWRGDWLLTAEERRQVEEHRA